MSSMEFNTPHSSTRTDEDHDGEYFENDEGLQLLAHRAAKTGNIPMLMKAVNHDPSALESQDEKGLTPLSRAVSSKQLDMVKLLVKMGADINTQDSLGRTPLCLAAYEGWHHGVMYLLRSGGKQTIADRNGRLPLHAATYDKDSRSLSALLQTLTIGDVNEPDNDGMTALHWAAFHNRPEHVQLLMLRGGDLFCVDVDGKTPLHWASQNGCLACCSIMAKCRSGGAPLINMLEGSGRSCVHLASTAGYNNVLEEFIDVPGVEFESLDPDDRTPLHWASASVQVDCVEMLLQLGVDPSPQDINGATPQDYAKQAGSTEVMKVLQKAGAEFGTISTSSKTSQDLAKITEGEKREPWKKRFGFISDWLNRRKNGLKYKTPSEEANEPNGVKERTVVAKAKSSEHLNYAAGYEPDNQCDHMTGSSEDDLSEETPHRAAVNRTRTKPNGSQDSLNQATRNQRSLSDDLSYTRRNSFPEGSSSLTVRTTNKPSPGSNPSVTFPMHVDNGQLKDSLSDKHALSSLPSPGVSKSPGLLSDEIIFLEGTVPMRPLCRDLPDADTVQRHAQEILDAQRSESSLSNSSGKPVPSLSGRSLSHKNLFTSSLPKLAPLTTRPALSPGIGTTVISPSIFSRSDSTSVSMPSHYSTFKQRSLSISLETKYSGSCPAINHKGLISGNSLKASRLEALQPIQPHTTEKKKKKKKKKPKPVPTLKLQENMDVTDTTLPTSAGPHDHHTSPVSSPTLDSPATPVDVITES